MAISLYDVTVPVFIRSLTNLASFLRKAGYQAAYKGYPAALLLQSRLYPDMYELSQQVKRAADIASETIELYSGINSVTFTEDVVTIEQHIAYVNHSISYLLTIAPRQFAGLEQQSFTLPPQHEERYSALGYALFYTLPNFYFHITTAYNILRHNGVEIGKQDYLGLHNYQQDGWHSDGSGI
ncbi:MAG TPA: DUF1993 domain-containing protein [Rheinheimera sp.]|uniref:DUF1993 domain-containing protein n=1 Tax=Rheinheimera sp. TaxID=1869214 RepID=UPI002F93AA4E